MVYTITDNCIACGDCCVVCKTDAIKDGFTDFSPDNSPGKKKFADTFYITDKCVGCGECIEVCPTNAIIFA